MVWQWQWQHAVVDAEYTEGSVDRDLRRVVAMLLPSHGFILRLTACTRRACCVCSSGLALLLRRVGPAPAATLEVMHYDLAADN